MAKLQDDYLAGLWKKDLLYGLLWDGHLNGTTAPVYRAPSWSWASVDGPIQYHIVDGPILYHVKDKHRQLYPLAQVLESFTTIANRDDITAEVKDGYIRLSGHLQRIQLSNAPESIGCSYTDYKWNFGLKKGSGSTESLDELIFTGTPAGSQAADLCISLSARNAYKNSQVFLMPLLDNKTTDGPYSVFGLALYPVEGFIGAYTKFGVFGMSRGCQECVFHTETKLGEQYFERIDGLDKYVVKIV
jgi:hypothetical protein